MRAIAEIISRNNQLDVVVHSANHTATDRRRPSRQSSWPSFTYQRPGRAAGQSRRPAAVAQAGPRPAGVGFFKRYARWHPPYLGPYFAAKAAMDALAVSYAGELARWESKPPSSCLDPSPREPTITLTRAGRPMRKGRGIRRWPDR